MDRTLRPLAVLSLAAAVVFAVVVNHGPSRDDPASLTFYQLPEPLLEQTSFLLAFAVGVVALVAALWRGQRAWVAGFLLALLVVAYGYILFFTYASATVFLAFFRMLPFLSDVGILRNALIPALLPLLALVYVWWPRRAPSTASSRNIPVDRVLRVLAVVSLLVALSLIPAVAYVTSVENAGQVDLGFWRSLSFWTTLLGQTSLLLAFAVGVVAVTVAQWRGQRAWTTVLLLALLVVAYALIVAIYATIKFQLSVALPPNSVAGIDLLGQGAIPALLPLLALAYTLWPHRADPVSDAEVAPRNPPLVGRAESVA